MSQEKTVSWHIPRVSLSCSSSSSGSNYNGSLKKTRRNSAPFCAEGAGSQELKYYSKPLEARQAHGNMKKFEPDKRRMSCDLHLPKHKRGSHSSQGSSNSNFSTSSLQLTVANLENFAKSQEARAQTAHRFPPPDYQRDDVYFKENPKVISGEFVKECTTIPIVDHHQNLLTNFNNFNLFSEKNFTLPKIPDEETCSIASSTHFTMVNGFGTPSRFKESTDRRLCSRTNQITVLIVTMSLFFLFAIIFLLFMMQMRAQKMTDMEMSLKT